MEYHLENPSLEWLDETPLTEMDFFLLEDSDVEALYDEWDFYEEHRKHYEDNKEDRDVR